MDFSACDVGLKCEKSVDDTLVSTTYFAINDDNVVEYKDIEGFLVENSTMTKQDDGTLVQEFLSGETKVYNNILNNEEFPTEIIFNPSVEDYENVEVGIN